MNETREVVKVSQGKSLDRSLLERRILLVSRIVEALSFSDLKVLLLNFYDDIIKGEIPLCDFIVVCGPTGSKIYAFKPLACNVS